ncbi:MAG: wax ester/triacylglycerol synthase family O-acyltransferase [Acidimicrobiales bacterium]
MERLAGGDSGFLFIETPTQTSVCVDLAILTPPAPGAPPLTLPILRAHVAERLHLLASWHWRLQEVPLGLHHPVFIEDPDFDLDYHLRERTIPAPGGQAELDALLADIEPRLLDLRHPLWQIVLVHGLADPDGGTSRQALVFRFHHTIADGAALLHSLDLLFHPVPEDRPAPDHLPEGDHPTKRELLAAAAKEQARNWREIPALLKDTKARFTDVEARKADPEVAPVPRSIGDAPWCILNQSGPPVRSYARTLLPLEELQAIRKATGATMNDVALAIVGGALRAYLLERDALPERSLVVNCPVSGDPPGTPPRQWGNRFANFFAVLGTDVEDPAERLATISASTKEAKHQLEVLGHDTLTRWLDRMPPLVGRRAARWMVDRNARDLEKADYNVLVSNVRVTNEGWEIGGHELERLFLSGPIGDEAGVNITVVGYRGMLHVTVVASPVAVPDAHRITALVEQSLEDLRACTV